MYYQRAGARTRSGLGSTSEKAYLYVRHMIFREKADPQQYSAFMAALDGSSITLEDSDNDSSSRKRTRTGMKKHKKMATEYHIVRCCHCPHVWGPIPDHDKTTSGYSRHFRNHHKSLPSDATEEAAYLHKHQKQHNDSGTLQSKSSLDNPWSRAAAAKNSGRLLGEQFCEKTYRELLAAFIVETNSAFSLVESTTFHKLIRYLNSAAPLLSRRTLVKDITALHDNLKPHLKEQFRKHTTVDGGRISLTLDAWSSSFSRRAYLGITAHWMDSNFQLHDIVIAFKLLRGSHTAANIAAVVLRVLKDWNIEQHIREITTDNASVNDKMFSDIQKLKPVIERTHTQIRCMAHIINLAAQAILTNLKAEATEHEAVMADELHLVSQPTISCGPSEILRNCRRIISKIRASNLLWDALVLHCQTTKIKFLHPILDMRIRWNSSFNMIDRMLYLRPAITKLVASEKKLQALQLSSADWVLLERLKRILSVFVRATIRLSGCKYPTLQM
jgi:hypothetical protein